MTTVVRHSVMTAAGGSRQLPDGIAPGQGDRWGRGGCGRQQPAEMGRASKLKLLFLQQSLWFWPSVLLLPVISPIIKKNGDKRGVQRRLQDPGIPGEACEKGGSDLWM